MGKQTFTAQCVKQQFSTLRNSQIFKMSPIFFQMLIPCKVAGVSQKQITVSDSSYYD